MSLNPWPRRIGKGIFAFGLISAALAANIYFAPAWWGLKAYLVPTDSMAPTLIPGDIVLVNLSAYANAAPRAGEIVVFGDPTVANGLTLIKLVVRVDSHCADQTICPQSEGAVVHVQGDNATHSYDSRHFGPIPVSSLQGRAVVVLVTVNASGEVDVSRSGWL